jgi:hypothetical protein
MSAVGARLLHASTRNRFSSSMISCRSSSDRVPCYETRARAGYKLAEGRALQRTQRSRACQWVKDDFGGRTLRVRGHAKVACHLMFGILALTCDQLLRLIN